MTRPTRTTVAVGGSQDAATDLRNRPLQFGASVGRAVGEVERAAGEVGRAAGRVGRAGGGGG